MPAPSSAGGTRARDVATAALVGVAVASSLIGVANGLLGICLIAAAVALRGGQFAGRPRARVLLPPLAALALVTLLSAAFSLDPLHSLSKTPRLLVFLLVPLAAALIDEKVWTWVLGGLVAFTTVLSLWGVVQYVQGADSLADRIHGYVSHYMTFSGLLLLAVLVFVAEAILRPRRRRLWLLLPAALGTVAIVLSLTRNAWVGLVVGLLLLAATWKRRLLLAYPLLAVVFWLAAPRAVLDRVVSVFDLRQHANYDRLCMLVSGVEMIRDRPWLGLGPDMVSQLYPLYRRDDAPRWNVPHLHNNLLQLGAERGLLGLASYLWLLGAFFVVTWRGLPRLDPERRAGAAAALVAVAGITAAGLFEYNFWDAEVQYLTLVLLGVGAGRVETVT